MAAEKIDNQLQSIAAMDKFAELSAQLVQSWSSAGAGLEVVEPILRFMERHPSINYGMPGAIVHFVERFYGNGYEEKLIESIERQPTPHTVWMLNRVINGAETPEKKRSLVEVMERVRQNPAANQNTLQLASGFLERLSK